jgi:hypothetical protein
VERIQFPSSFQLRTSLQKLSAARSIAFRVLSRASQSYDVPPPRSKLSNNQWLTRLFLHTLRSQMIATSAPFSSREAPAAGRLCSNAQTETHLHASTSVYQMSRKLGNAMRVLWRLGPINDEGPNSIRTARQPSDRRGWRGARGCSRRPVL